MPIIAGVDGCSTGWVVATQESNDARIECRVVESIDSILTNRPIPAVVAIDIPIGLPESGPRVCDVAARARLGARRSSVFPAPVRAVLAAESQAEASAIGKRTDGRGVSCQCWNIVPKIREVDHLLRRRPDLRTRVHEVHPELSFCCLNGGVPLSHPKRKSAGRNERLAVLQSVFPADAIREAISACRPQKAQVDDVLDALVALWSARRISRGQAEPFPPRTDKDRHGIAMQILA